MDCSRVPKPDERNVPDIDKSPKSARFVRIEPVAAQPGCLLKSVRRNSFIHTSTLFGCILSSSDRAVFLGFLTPIIMTATSDMEGESNTVIFLPFITSVYGRAEETDLSPPLIFLLRFSFTFTMSSKPISTLFAVGHLTSF